MKSTFWANNHFMFSHRVVCELKVGAASRSFAKASQYGFGETAKVL